jgi:imidazole glycerol phosphate synthase glutamine amidotransferase subunit
VKVALIEYGAGNVASVERALQRLATESIRATTADCIRNADALILPGVGHFAALIRSLDEHGLRAPLRDALRRGTPFLGICLGLQALFQSSDEAPDLCGLQFFPGKIQAIPATVKLPHMGWNQVRATRNSRLLKGISPGAHFYFAHSYAASVEQEATHTAAICNYGFVFVSVIEFENVHAVQFHPEKSGAAGALVLQNFLGLAE